MAGLVDKFKRMWDAPDDEYDEYDEYAYEEESEEDLTRQAAAHHHRRIILTREKALPRPGATRL